jgi:hypothetical protein
VATYAHYEGPDCTFLTRAKALQIARWCRPHGTKVRHSVDGQGTHRIEVPLEGSKRLVAFFRTKRGAEGWIATIDREEEEERRRADLAEILDAVAKEGLPGPRDLDVALDAIEALFA